jgi:hypothetical protein
VKGKASIWISFVLLASMVSGRAEVIVDNIDGVRSFYTTRDPISAGVFSYRNPAQMFSLGEGLSYRLTSVTVPIMFNGGTENTMTVSIWDSRRMGGGAIQPGMPAPSQMLAVIGSRTFSGNTAFESYETFTDFGDVTLPNGSYWLMVQETPGLDSILWPTVNRHTSYLTYRETGTGGIDYFGQGDPTSDRWSVSSTGATVASLAIEGTRVATVPEPGITALGIVGLGMLVARRMRW